MYSQGSSAPPPHRRSANEDATVNHVRSPHENHVQLAPVEPPAAPLPRPSLEERVQLFRKQFKSGKGPLDKVLFEFIDSDDEEEEKEREKAAAEVKQEMGKLSKPRVCFFFGSKRIGFRFSTVVKISGLLVVLPVIQNFALPWNPYQVKLHYLCTKR